MPSYGSVVPFKMNMRGETAWAIRGEGAETSRHVSRPPDIKVLFILGSSRCGSTVLAGILGELEGLFSAGEIRHLWIDLIEERLCGCGRPIGECPVWSQVLRKASTYSRAGQVDPRKVLEWEREALRFHHGARIMSLSGRWRTGGSALSAYSDAILSIYRSLADVTGARVIVDSGKHSSHGALLRLLPGVRPYLVHLVRDPRAVAFSQSRVKPNPDGGPRNALGGVHPIKSLAYWNGINLASEAVRRRQGSDRSLLVRYEDFMADPIAAIQRITNFVGVPSGSVPAPFIDEHTVDVGCNHMISGNPTRFQRGKIPLRRDDRWLAEMPTKHRMLANALGLALALRYGYPIWR